MSVLLKNIHYELVKLLILLNHPRVHFKIMGSKHKALVYFQFKAVFMEIGSSVFSWKIYWLTNDLVIQTWVFGRYFFKSKWSELSLKFSYENQNFRELPRDTWTWHFPKVFSDGISGDTTSIIFWYSVIKCVDILEICITQRTSSFQMTISCYKWFMFKRSIQSARKTNGF